MAQNAKVEILKQKGYNFLWINDYLWMWDIPIEQATQKKIADKAYGRVLVAGYGLGIVQRYLSINSRVKEIVTLELESKVLQVCLNEYGRLYGMVLVEDFYKHKTSLGYDCVIGDIWEDIFPEELDKYKKFKSKAETLIKPGGNILAWGKDFFEYLIKQEKA